MKLLMTGARMRAAARPACQKLITQSVAESTSRTAWYPSTPDGCQVCCLFRQSCT